MKLLRSLWPFVLRSTYERGLGKAQNSDYAIGWEEGYDAGFVEASLVRLNHGYQPLGSKRSDPHMLPVTTTEA